MSSSPSNPLPCESVVLAAVRTIESVYGPLRSLTFVTEDGTEVVTRPAPPPLRRFHLPEPPPHPHPEPAAAHSLDYRSCTVRGERYTFSATQATIVRLLWEAHGNGTPDVGGQTLLEAADSEAAQLRDVFRARGQMHPAWGTLIVPSEDSQGAYHLSFS